MSVAVESHHRVGRGLATSLWVPAWVFLVVAGVLVEPQPKLTFVCLAGLAGLAALVVTRGRGFVLGLPVGLLVGAATIGVIWYLDTRGFTIPAAIVAAAIVLGTSIVFAAGHVAKARRRA